MFKMVNTVRNIDPPATKKVVIQGIKIKLERLKGFERTGCLTCRMTIAFSMERSSDGSP